MSARPPAGHRHPEPGPGSRVRPTEEALGVWLAAKAGAGEPPPRERVDRVRAKLGDPSAHLVLAERGGRIVGMALAEPFRAEGGHGRVVPGRGHVSMVFVDPRAQGRGVGRELVGRLVDEGPWDDLSVWTRRTNARARALYRGQGFHLTGEVGRTPAGAVTERWCRERERTSDAVAATRSTPPSP